MVALTHLVHPVVHHDDIRMDPTLGIYGFNRKTRFNGRSRDELMMSDIEPSAAAFGYGRGYGHRRPTNSNGGEEAGGRVLNDLLHVLTKMAHLGRLGVRPGGGSSIRSSVAQTEGRNIRGGDHDI